jgi:hypothetical protein
MPSLREALAGALSPVRGIEQLADRQAVGLLSR